MEKYYIHLSELRVWQPSVNFPGIYLAYEVDARIADLRGTLMELRTRLHAEGRRPEECYEMHLIDSVL